QDVTRRTASAGYLGVAPHVFHRSGGGVVSYGDMEGVMKHFQALSDKGLLDDIDATLGLIHGEGITDGSVGVVGFCVGGRLTFVAGAERALGAASAFYGGGVAEGRSENMPSRLHALSHMKTPRLGPFGHPDKRISTHDGEQ